MAIKTGYMVTGPGDNHTEDLVEIWLNQRAALLRALDWAGDDMDEAETLSTEALWERLDNLIEQTGEPITVTEHDLFDEVIEEPA